MAKEDKVMAMVAKELEANPNVSNQELMEKAKKLNPAVGRLNMRQFNARYRLQIKRWKARGGAAAAPAAPAAPARRRRAPARAAARKPRAARRAGARGPRAARAARAPGAAYAGADRDGIRGVFLRFAKDVVRAVGKPDMVDVMGGVDKHVDQVIRLAARG